MPKEGKNKNHECITFKEAKYSGRGSMRNQISLVSSNQIKQGKRTHYTVTGIQGHVSIILDALAGTTRVNVNNTL